MQSRCTQILSHHNCCWVLETRRAWYKLICSKSPKCEEWGWTAGSIAPIDLLYRSIPAAHLHSLCRWTCLFLSVRNYHVPQNKKIYVKLIFFSPFLAVFYYGYYKFPAKCYQSTYYQVYWKLFFFILFCGKSLDKKTWWSMQIEIPWEQTFLKCISKPSPGNLNMGISDQFAVLPEFMFTDLMFRSTKVLIRQCCLISAISYFCFYPSSFWNWEVKNKKKKDNFILYTVCFGKSEVFFPVSGSFWLQALIFQLIGSKIRLNSIMLKMGKHIYPGSFFMSAWCCGISRRWLHSMHCWIMQIMYEFRAGAALSKHYLAIVNLILQLF